jgi:hypothetical protein
MSVALTRMGGIMRKRVTIISIVLVFAFALTATAQDANYPDDEIANLKQQLMELESIQTESLIRLEELNEQLKPQNIEIAVAGIGSIHPEELREHRRNLLTIERDGVQKRLELLEEKHTRISAAIAAAEFAEYLKYAQPSPTPSPATLPFQPMAQLTTSLEEVCPVTNTLRGVIITNGPDSQSYGVANANLKLRGAAQLIEVSSNDQGEYEFANLSVGTYTLEVSAEGFKTTIKTVTVRSGEPLIQTISLEVADS